MKAPMKLRLQKDLEIELWDPRARTNINLSSSPHMTVLMSHAMQVVTTLSITHNDVQTTY